MNSIVRRNDPLPAVQSTLSNWRHVADPANYEPFQRQLNLAMRGNGEVAASHLRALGGSVPVVAFVRELDLGLTKPLVKMSVLIAALDPAQRVLGMGAPLCGRDVKAAERNMARVSLTRELRQLGAASVLAKMYQSVRDEKLLIASRYRSDVSVDADHYDDLLETFGWQLPPGGTPPVLVADLSPGQKKTLVKRQSRWPLSLGKVRAGANVDLLSGKVGGDIEFEAEFSDGPQR